MFSFIFSGLDPERCHYEQALNDAKTYEEWHDAALHLDRLDGLHKWREDPSSEDYDYVTLLEYFKLLRHSNETKNYMYTLTLLRTCLARNFCNLKNRSLFMKCRVGTKHLIEDFLRELVESIKMIGECMPEATGSEKRRKYDYLKYLEKIHGKTALMLSGGGVLAVAHAGAYKVLNERGLMPSIVTGASGGSMSALYIVTDSIDLANQIAGRPGRAVCVRDLEPYPPTARELPQKESPYSSLVLRALATAVTSPPSYPAVALGLPLRAYRHLEVGR